MNTDDGRIYEMLTTESLKGLSERLNAPLAALEELTKAPDSTCPKCRGTGVKKIMFSGRRVPCECTGPITESDASENGNPIVLVDFDGVIHSCKSGWKGIDVIPDEPVDGAINWLMQHLPIPEAISAMGPEYKGPEVQIYSARSRERKGIKAMQDWLVKNSLPACYITDDILKFPTQKPPAFLTLDDRVWCFDGRFPTADEMMAFRPWYKRDIGATGNFPDGKVSPEDEGEIQFRVGHNQDHVKIEFGKPVAWLEMPPELARQLAESLLKHASDIRE